MKTWQSWLFGFLVGFVILMSVNLLSLAIKDRPLEIVDMNFTVKMWQLISLVVIIICFAIMRYCFTPFEELPSKESPQKLPK